MAPSPLQQRRTHNTLLFQKLLNLREGASPFTLVLDTLEQSGRPIVREFATRAKISKSKIIYISFSTLRAKVHFEIGTFISARSKTLAVLRAEILSHIPTPAPSAPPTSSNPTKILLIIDTLHPLSSHHAPHLSPFLSSLLITPHISLLATYHTDIPLPSCPLSPSYHNPYQPTPQTTLTYLATAILTISSLHHTLARKKARDKSLQEPAFGLGEGRDGVVFGLRGGKDGERGRGVVVGMELRRRSGRGVVETFVLFPPSLPTSSAPTSTSASTTTASASGKLAGIGEFMLLDEYPSYATVPASSEGNGGEKEGGEEVETTFNLGLTEKQKRDREGVVLPYFDAQRDGGREGPGDGGRILYEMGAEDREDFDDEEDEI